MTPAEALVRFLMSKGLLQSDPPTELTESLQELPIWSLSRNGLLSEMEAIQVICGTLDVPYVDLESEDTIQRMTLEGFTTRIRPRLCWKARVIPLWEDDEYVHVACANPFEQETLNGIGFILSKPVKTYIAEESKIVTLLAKHFPQQHIELDDDDGSDDSCSVTGFNEDIQDLDNSNPTATPIVKLTNKIIHDAIKLGASDVHFEPNENTLAVRLRIDGIMQDIITIPKQIRRNVTLRLKILGGMDISEKRRPQDGRIRVTYANRRVDMRVSSIPASSGEKIVLRILRADYESLTFEKLGMPFEAQERLEQALNRKGKLLLVSGPTGSGKTTTLYVALNYLCDGTTNITTIEDPIEYKFQHINQIQVNNAVDVNFASVLRAVLRQDPDIVMIGEIRDTETLKVVLQAAQTGHLVLSTVHTNDAPSVVSRLLDLGADPFNLSTSLAGVLAQRLVRQICEKCAAPVDPAGLRQYAKYIKRYNIDVSNIRSGKGCPDCYYSGYKGRCGVYSYLHISDQVSELIYQKASQDELIEAARHAGFVGLDEAAIILLSEGKTSLDEIVPYLSLEEPRPKISSASQAGVSVGQGAAALPQPVYGAAAQPAVQELRIRMDGGPMQTSRVGSEGLVGKPRVLVIDDNRSVRKMLAALLQREMVVVDEAENGLDALEKVYAELPHLIVCDVRMPEMDGREFLQRMQKNKRTRDIPVIMLTVDDSEEDELDLIDSGACEFLSKRSPPDILLSRIRRVLNSL